MRINFISFMIFRQIRPLTPTTNCELCNCCVKSNKIPSAQLFYYFQVSLKCYDIKGYYQVWLTLSIAFIESMYISRLHYYKYACLMHQIEFIPINSHDMTFPLNVSALIFADILSACLLIGRDSPPAVLDEVFPFNSWINFVTSMRISRINIANHIIS